MGFREQIKESTADGSELVEVDLAVLSEISNHPKCLNLNWMLRKLRTGGWCKRMTTDSVVKQMHDLG